MTLNNVREFCKLFKITENDFQNFQKQHFPSLFKPCFICVQQVVVLYARNVLHYNLNYVELNQYCLLLFSKKSDLPKKSDNAGHHS